MSPSSPVSSGTTSSNRTLVFGATQAEETGLMSEQFPSTVEPFTAMAASRKDRYCPGTTALHYRDSDEIMESTS